MAALGAGSQAAMGALARTGWRRVEEGLRHYLALCSLQVRLVGLQEAEALTGLLEEKDRCLEGVQDAFKAVRGEDLPESVSALADQIASCESQAMDALRGQLASVRLELKQLAQGREVHRAYGGQSVSPAFFLDSRD